MRSSLPRQLARNTLNKCNNKQHKSSRLRAGGAFLAAATALFPMPLIAFGLSAIGEPPWAHYVIWPLFLAPQLAFPLRLERLDPFAQTRVPGALIFVVWIALTLVFAYAASRLRPKRLWFAAPLAVVLCIVAGNALIHLAGYSVPLDGP